MTMDAHDRREAQALRRVAGILAASAGAEIIGTVTAMLGGQPQ